MRVLHVGKYYPPFSGGIENFMGDLLPALVQNDIQVAAVVHHHDPRYFKCSPTVQDNILLYRAPCHGSLVYAPVSPLFPIVLRRAVKAFKPDLLHVHMPNTSAFWVLFMPELRRLPMVVHWHADVVFSDIDPFLGKAYRMYQPLEHQLLKHARTIIATSLPYLSTSRALQPWRTKCAVVPLGLRERQPSEIESGIKQKAESLWGGSGFRVISIGRLTYYKGHDLLINASAALKDIRVLIVGTGELMASLKQRLADLKIENRISLLGHVDDQTLKALIAGADCLALPSKERTEAFGLVLLEAMREGKPAIVCQVPGSGMGWVVQDQITGIHVPVGDCEALTDAIRWLMNRPDQVEILGRNARERFQSMFSIQAVAEAIKKIYQKILDDSRCPSG